MAIRQAPDNGLTHGGQLPRADAERGRAVKKEAEMNHGRSGGMRREELPRITRISCVKSALNLRTDPLSVFSARFVVHALIW
jgi:hypothetical protein